jgi:rhamnosyltransferase
VIKITDHETKNTVAVLLATHNPNPVYLEEFIESLEKQDTLKFDLIWNDDGSSETIYDAARKIIDRKFECLGTRYRVGGAKENFMSMLKANHTYEYIFFADQDDIWLPNRISRQITLFNEVHMSSNKPAGNYFNPIIFDKERESTLNRDAAEFHVLLATNTVQGCTLMINQAAAKKLIESDYSQAIMHDWWISLYLCAFKSLYYFDEPLLKYRIHEDNLVGIPSAGKKLRLYLCRKSGVLSAQNYSFYKQFQLELPPESALNLQFWLANYMTSRRMRIISIFTDTRRYQSLPKDLFRRLLHGLRRP